MLERNRKSSTGEMVKDCECGGRCEVQYKENREYEVICENCGSLAKFRCRSFDEAVKFWNDKSFDGMLRTGQWTKAARLFADNYHKSGKMGYTRRCLIYDMADMLDNYENGFFLTYDAYDRLMAHKLKEECEYCVDIENATPKSPRRRYKYCPMCGRKRNC